MPDDSNGTHRVVGKRHVVTTNGLRPEVYEVGDRFSPSDATLAAHPNRFVPVDDADVEADEADEEDEDDRLPPAVPHDLTVDELAEWADGVDDPKAVASAADAEEASKDRKTAIEALHNRLEELGVEVHTDEDDEEE